MKLFSAHSWRLDAAGETLKPLTGRLTLDDSWSPYIQGDCDVAAPAALASIDPRVTLTASLLLIQRFGELAVTADLSTMFGGKLTSAISTAFGSRPTSDISNWPNRAWNDTFVQATARELKLFLRSRQRTDDGAYALRLASGEMLLQDLKLLSASPSYRNIGTVRALVLALFAELALLSPYTFALAAGDADAAIQAGIDSSHPAEVWTIQTQGQSYWDFITPFLQAGNLRLWCDEAGLFHLDPNTLTATAGAIAMNVSDGSLLRAGEVIDRDRDEWADGIVLEYLENPTNAGYQRHSIYPYDGRPVTKVLLIEIPAITPFTPFTADPSLPAQRVFNRMAGRGRVVPVTAVNDYTTTPRMAATITSLDTPVQTGIVQAVAWSFPTDEMTVTTRQLTE